MVLNRKHCPGQCGCSRLKMGSSEESLLQFQVKAGQEADRRKKLKRANLLHSYRRLGTIPPFKCIFSLS